MAYFRFPRAACRAAIFDFMTSYGCLIGAYVSSCRHKNGGAQEI